MDLIELIKKLHASPSPSGQEKLIQFIIKDLVRPYVNDISYDIHGNLICIKRAKNYEHAKTLMLIAHVDEVGLMISHIEENGFLRFAKIGGVDTSILRGRAVQIIHDRKMISGIIGCKPTHMKERTDKELDISDLWIDIGADNSECAEEIVSVGDTVVLESAFHEISDNYISGRGFDDKIGVATLIKVFERISPNQLDFNLILVCSVQEEVGFRGAMTSSYNIKPDICIAVDVTHATDYPGINKAKYGNIRLGKGAVVSFGTDLSSNIQNEFCSLAKAHDIPYQILAQPGSSRTDIHAIQISRGGCVSGLISIPCRYMHSPVETICVEDIKNAIELISLFCKRITSFYEQAIVI